MSTPISDRRTSLALAVAAVGLAVAAVACSPDTEDGSPGSGTTASPAAGATTASIACAVNGALNYSDGCTAERVEVDDDPVLVIRHPDGGFRRFDLLTGGTLAEADGALRATVLRTGTTLEVTIGSDRYRLDASLAGDVP